MGIFDWLFRNEPNEDIERKRRRKERIRKSLEEFKENKKIEENKEAEYKAFLNENTRVLCDDGVERLFFPNQDKMITGDITTVKVKKITVEKDESIYSVPAEIPPGGIPFGGSWKSSSYVEVLESEKKVKVEKAKAKRERTLSNKFNELIEKYPSVRRRLRKKLPGSLLGGFLDYTLDQGIRAYLYNKSGFEINGLSKKDLNKIIKLVESDIDIKNFIDALQLITKKEKWVQPNDLWNSYGETYGSILKDLYKTSEKVGLQGDLAVRPFRSSIEVNKWFNKKGETLNKDEIILYRQAMFSADNDIRRSLSFKPNYAVFETGFRELKIINDYAFEVDCKYNTSARMFSLFSGSIDETTYKNGESKSKNKKGPNVDQLNQVINDVLLDLISFDLVEDKKLKIKNKESGERVGFFIEEIVYNSYNEIVYRSGHQVCDDGEWNQVENTDELITFFIDKDGKFVDSPDNVQEVITSYNNGTYCMSELNKVFLEHSKQYKINDTEVYNKRHILKVLKDIKE